MNHVYKLNLKRLFNPVVMMIMWNIEKANKMNKILHFKKIIWKQSNIVLLYLDFFYLRYYYNIDEDARNFNHYPTKTLNQIIKTRKKFILSVSTEESNFFACVGLVDLVWISPFLRKL